MSQQEEKVDFGILEIISNEIGTAMGEIEYINIFVHKQLQEFELPDGFKPLSSQDKTEGDNYGYWSGIS